LAWAVPAAITGGPEFAEMIFWRQSADRIATSFAHDRPFWFYIPVLVAFLFPLLFWRPLWRAAEALRTSPFSPETRFLLCWLVSTFLLFSIFRGKQPHYLLPLLPGLALLVAETLRRAEVRKGDALLLAVPTVALPLVISVAPYALGHFIKTGHSNVVRDGIGNFEPIWFVLAAALALAALAALRRTLHAQALAIVIGSALFVAAAAWECHRAVFKYFDLEPIARALQPLEDKPLAFESPYHGELGFMARLARPIEIVSSRKLAEWLANNPEGAAVVRHRKASEIAGFEVIYTQPYRNREMLSIVRHPTGASR
jgi:4-amino-4-deoxy-L-arabinose transferase-like glycosyltransferase